MSLKDRVNNTLQHAVNRSDGMGEQITYTHSKTNLVENINSIPEQITYGELSKDKDKSYVIFQGLFLATPPNKGDSINWNGNTYHHFKTMSDLGNSYYDVQAYISRHTTQRGKR